MTTRVLTGLTFILMAHPSYAALGGNASTVESDRVQVKAQAKAVRNEAAYSVHSMEASGTTVKEFIDANGTVFAVSWSGLAKPDLSTLFGDHYSDYVNAKSKKRHEPGRAPLRVQTPTLVVRHAGHMRAVSGQAYLSDLLPSGVKPEDLK